jgi:hypothetical protein
LLMLLVLLLVLLLARVCDGLRARRLLVLRGCAALCCRVTAGGAHSLSAHGRGITQLSSRILGNGVALGSRRK